MPSLVPFSTIKTITRYASGAYVKPREGGRWLDGMVVLYSDTELQPGTDTAIGDRLTHEGVLYEVTGCNLWDHIPRISHYECYAQRVANNT